MSNSAFKRQNYDYRNLQLHLQLLEKDRDSWKIVISLVFPICRHIDRWKTK